MELLISDTNIFIDLYVSGLLDCCRQLDVEFHTVDFVIHEITDNEQKKAVQELVNTGDLLVERFSPDETLELLEWYERFENRSNLSLTDCAVMLCAKKGGYRLLTGDKMLRLKATNEGITVSGILYLTDMMVDNGVVDRVTMASSLEILLAQNNRLPKALFLERIESYREFDK